MGWRLSLGVLYTPRTPIFNLSPHDSDWLYVEANSIPTNVQSLSVAAASEDLGPKINFVNSRGQRAIIFFDRLLFLKDPVLQPYAARLAGVRYAGASGPDGDDDSAFEDRPQNFIGVASRSRSRSVLHYYGIERHDRWVFTPLFR